jgi:hypothetical protein
VRQHARVVATWRWKWLGQTTSRFPRSSKNHCSENDARPALDRSQTVTPVDQNRDALQGSAAFSRRSLAFRARRHRSSYSDSPRPNCAQSAAYIQWQLCGRWIASATVRSWPDLRRSELHRQPTWSLQIFLRTSTESLPTENRETPSDCFYEHIRLTLRLSVIVSRQAKFTNWQCTFC